MAAAGRVDLIPVCKQNHQEKRLSADTLTALNLTPANVPSLSTNLRRKLTGYLLRWGHFDQARRCLQQALVTRPDLVSIYDDLARAYLGLDQPDRALEIMRRRESLKVSTLSRRLVIRAHVARDDLETALQVSKALLALFMLLLRRPACPWSAFGVELHRSIGVTFSRVGVVVTELP